MNLNFAPGIINVPGEILCTADMLYGSYPMLHFRFRVGIRQSRQCFLQQFRGEINFYPSNRHGNRLRMNHDANANNGLHSNNHGCKCQL